MDDTEAAEMRRRIADLEAQVANLSIPVWSTTSNRAVTRGGTTLYVLEGGRSCPS